MVRKSWSGASKRTVRRSVSFRSCPHQMALAFHETSFAPFRSVLEIQISMVAPSTR